MTEEVKDVIFGLAFSALFWVVLLGTIAMGLRACGR